MRPIQLADVEAAARVLLAAPVPAQGALMAELLRRADAADRYRKRLRRAHPQWGTGTLLSAACLLPMAPRPDAITPDVLRAYAAVIAGLCHQSA